MLRLTKKQSHLDSIEAYASCYCMAQVCSCVCGCPCDCGGLAALAWSAGALSQPASGSISYGEAQSESLTMHNLAN
jgi:hypothetical protein